MTHGFQQQDPALGFLVPKSTPSPQHGQKPEMLKAQPIHPPRGFEPRRGH